MSHEYSPERQPYGDPPQQGPQQGPPEGTSPGYGPPQGPHRTYGYGPHQPGGPGPRNGLGTAALVLGIIAAVFAFIPLAGIFVAIPLAALAVILGAVGIGRAVKGSATNKGVAISGTALGAVAIALTSVMTAAVFNAVDGSTPAARGPSEGQDSAQAGDRDGAGGAGQSPAAGVGDTVRSGDLGLTVTDVRARSEVSDDFGYTEEARGKFVIVDVRAQNTGDDQYSFFAGSVNAYDDEGQEYSSTSDVAFVLGETDLAEPINPGQSATGYIAYDVPEGVTLSHIEVSGGFLAEPVVVGLE